MSIRELLHDLLYDLYALPNESIEKCDIMVPIDYSLCSGMELSLMEMMILTEATNMAGPIKAIMVWATHNRLGEGWQEKGDHLKIQHVRRMIPKQQIVIAQEGCANSVDEAQHIRRALELVGVPLEGCTIVCVCSWPHARSILRIWKEVFPDSQIMIHTRGRDKKDHFSGDNRQVLLRSFPRFFIANVLRHLALTIFGAKRIARIRAPISAR